MTNRPYVRGLAFVNEGKELAAANGDSTVWLLEVPAAKAKEETKEDEDKYEEKERSSAAAAPP